MPTGLFITLEGGDGSGKSTQIKFLLRRLQTRHINSVAVREPGGTPLGNGLRQLLKFSDIPLSPEAELLLFNASRAQLVADVIQPALERGEVVLCDRFTDSTLAYQGYGRGIPLERVEAVNMAATGGLKPDLTIFLDLSPEEGMGRRSTTRDRFEQRFEQKGIMDFHQRVRKGYLELASKEPERWLTLDARLSSREVSRLIWRRVEPLVGGIRP
ncbi:MAG: dTMP kinase [Chloroflexi bacterium]|nr:dTMP kinase [Chloroflexota bacterium]